MKETLKKCKDNIEEKTYLEYIRNFYNSILRRYTIYKWTKDLNKLHKWRFVDSKKKNQKNTWNDAHHHYQKGNANLNPQWDATTHPLESLKFKGKIILSVEAVEQLELTYITDRREYKRIQSFWETWPFFIHIDLLCYPEIPRYLLKKNENTWLQIIHKCS